MNKKELSLDGIKVPTEVFSRICGYFQPTISWNKGKRREFEDRKNYNIDSVDRSDHANKDILFI